MVRAASAHPCICSLQVIEYLLPHSFNLNPAIMSIVEVEMAEEAIETTTTSPQIELEAATSPTQPKSPTEGEVKVAAEGGEHAPSS